MLRYLVIGVTLAGTMLSDSHGQTDALDDLLKQYRELGLPEPPADAPLVTIRNGQRRRVGDPALKDVYQVGFLIEEKSKDDIVVVLMGTRRAKVHRVDIAPLDRTKFASDCLRADFSGDAFQMNSALITALQCQGRGWKEFATKLWDASLDPQNTDFPRDTTADRPPIAFLAFTAWMHWMNELVEPKSDRKAILARMKQTAALDDGFDNDDSREFLKRLEATLVPSKAKAGTPEALIDALVEVDERVNTLFEFGYLDDRCGDLLDMGFEAAPALIEHLDDERLTRSIVQGFNNFPTHPRTVGELCADLLQGLAGEDFDRSWLDRLRGESIDKAPVRTWFEKAKQDGEEKYIVARVLPTEGDEPNHYMLRVLAKRYPQQLAKVYRRLLSERPEMQSSRIVGALEQGSLTKGEKISVLVEAAKHKRLDHRRAAMWLLKDLDPNQFVEHLVATLDALPKTPAKPYWDCEEITFINLVIVTRDPRVWRALLRTAKRCDAGMRMEILEPMDHHAFGGPDEKAEQFQERLEFVIPFLDDLTLRDMTSNPEMYDDFFSAGAAFPRLRVCDMAAGVLAKMLEITDKPQKNWTVADWDHLRAKVRMAMQERCKTRRANGECK